LISSAAITNEAVATATMIALSGQIFTVVAGDVDEMREIAEVKLSLQSTIIAGIHRRSTGQLCHYKR